MSHEDDLFLPCCLTCGQPVRFEERRYHMNDKPDMHKDQETCIQALGRELNRLKGWSA